MGNAYERLLLLGIPTSVQPFHERARVNLLMACIWFPNLPLYNPNSAWVFNEDANLAPQAPEPLFLTNLQSAQLGLSRLHKGCQCFLQFNDQAEVPRTCSGLITIIHFKSVETTKLLLCVLPQVPHRCWLPGCFHGQGARGGTNCWNVVYLQTATTAPVFHNLKCRH